MEPLHSLVYVSAAVDPFSDDALQELLQRARQKNAQLGVTGLLLYADGNFMQCLEGARVAVSALFETISRDPRHHQVMTLVDEPVARREFGEWAMAFRRVDLPEWLRIAATSRPDRPAPSQASDVRALLIDFWRTCSR
jgi:hypothetical protein